MAQQNPFLDPTNPVAPEYLDLQRRQKIAEALMAQGLDQPQGQMVGQGQFARYVAPSWTQQLAPLLKAGMGQSLASGVEKEQQQLATALRKQGAADVQNVLNAFRSGDKNSAIAMASQSNSPQVQAIGTKLIEQQFKEPKWEKAELPQPDGSVRTGWVDLNSPQPELTFRSGGEKPAMSAKDRADLALSGQEFTFKTGQQPNFGGFSVSSGMGKRTDPVTGQTNQMHNGFDVKIPKDTQLSPLTTPEFNKDVGGRVLRVVPEAQSGGYGNMVEVQRQDGSVARYAHLSSINVKPGEPVTPNTVYGNPGSTGKSTGVHVHYEVKPPQGVQLASNTNMGMLSPKAQQEIATATAKERGKLQVEAEAALPKALATAQMGISAIQGMIGDTKVDEKGKIVYGKIKPHEGFESAVGISAAPLSGFIPGTATTDFKKRFGQIEGQAFLQAIDSLRGTGAISEVEGTKATSALNRMSLSQSEKEFIIAAREFESILKTGYENAQKRAGVQGSMNQSLANPNQSLSQQDREALNWANSNPNDPRSSQIKQRLGAQ